MKFNTSVLFDQQECLVVLAGKKTETPNNLLPVVTDEWNAFLKEEEDFRSFKLAGKHYFFVKTQKSDEAYRIIGFNVRSALGKAAKSVCIAGGKTNALLVAEGLALSNYQFIRYRNRH